MLNEDELKQAQRALDYYMANFDLTTSEKMASQRAYEALDRLIDGDAIASIWRVEDVLGLRTADDGQPDGSVTREQAREVLQRADHYHDATIGINWDVLEYHLDEVLREA